MSSTWNPLVDGTALAELGRVPDYANELWQAGHRRSGAVIETSTAFVDAFSIAFDRLGLADVAHAGMERYAGESEPPGSVRLRFHAVALFLHLAALVGALDRWVRWFYELAAQAGVKGSLADDRLLAALADRDPVLAGDLAARRAKVRRIEQLGLDAARPGGPRLLPPGRAAGEPPYDAADVEVGPDGVGLPTSPRRQWLNLLDLAAETCTDARYVLEDVARAATRRLRSGSGLDWDQRIEP